MAHCVKSPAAKPDSRSFDPGNPGDGKTDSHQFWPPHVYMHTKKVNK